MSSILGSANLTVSNQNGRLSCDSDGIFLLCFLATWLAKTPDTIFSSPQAHQLVRPSYRVALFKGISFVIIILSSFPLNWWCWNFSIIGWGLPIPIYSPKSTPLNLIQNFSPFSVFFKYVSMYLALCWKIKSSCFFCFAFSSSYFLLIFLLIFLQEGLL